MNATGLQLDEMMAAMQAMIAAGAEPETLTSEAPPEADEAVNYTPNSVAVQQLQSVQPAATPSGPTASNAVAAAALGAGSKQLPCPPLLADAAPTPPGWKEYGRNASNVFHCGYRTILEDRHATLQDPMNECVYDETGSLVGDDHPYAGCRGTPDQYYSKEEPWKHFRYDTGGPWYWGWSSLVESRRHSLDKLLRRKRKLPTGAPGSS